MIFCVIEKIILQWDYLTAEKIVVNTNDFHMGIYYLSIQSGTKLVTKKIIIQ